MMTNLHYAAALDIQLQHDQGSCGIFSGCLLGVLQHHEKINGSGYPMGVSAEKICPYAKILSVADIYDALVEILDFLL